MKRNLFLVFAIVLIATSCTSSAQKNSEDSSSADSSVETLVDDRQFLVKVGDTAPDFKMEMPDGSFVQLSELRGKVIMLQFTASWCGVCRKEMPHIEEQIWQKHKDNEEFALYGIDREEPVEKITMMREATGVTYPIGLDSDASIFGKYAENNAGITRNVIIDRDGKIVMLTRLYDEKEFGVMVDLINDLLE